MVSLLALLTTLSCREYAQLELPQTDQSLYVYAFFTSSGEISRVSLQSPKQKLSSIAVNQSEVLVVWTIPTGALISETGQPLDQDIIEQLGVRLSGAPSPTESCGRCTSSAFDGKQIMRPGDNCNIPPGTPYSITDGGALTEIDIETARKSIFLDFSGVCHCTIPKPEVAAPMSYQAHSVDGDAWAYSAHALMPDGSLGLFSEYHSQVVTPAGNTYRADHNDLKFPGPVTAVTGLTDGFLVVTKMPVSLEEPHAVFLVSQDLKTSTRVWTNESAKRKILAVSAGSDDERVFFSNWNQREKAPELLKCQRSQSGNYTCNAEAKAFLDQQIDQKISDFRVLPDGTKVFLLSRGYLGTGRGSPDNLTWDYHEIPASFLHDDEPHLLDTALKFNEHGDYWVLCAHGRRLSDNASSAIIFAAKKNVLPLEWEIIHRGGDHCYGATQKKSDPSKLLISVSLNETFELGFDKSWVRSSSLLNEMEGIDRPIALIETWRDNTSFFWAGDQSIFLRNTTSSSTARQWYGTKTFVSADFIETVVFQETILAVRQDGSVVKVSPDNKDIIYTSIQGLADKETIVAAHLSPYTQKLLIIVSGEISRILSVDPKTFRIEEELYRDSTRSMTNIVDTSGDQIFVTTASSEVLKIHQAQSHLVEFAWDNPNTIEMEVPPEKNKCLHDQRQITRNNFYSLKSGLWQAIGEKNGSIWIAGCDGALLRITTYGQDYLAQPMFLRTTSLIDLLNFLEDGKPAATALLPICADSIYAGTEGLRQYTEHQGRIFDVQQTGEQVSSEWTVEKNLEEFIRSDGAAQLILEIAIGPPVDLLGPPEYLRYVFNNRTTRTTLIGDLSGARGYIYDDDAVSAAQIRNELVVIGLRFGHLLIGRP